MSDTPTPGQPQRLVSLDAHRGFVMCVLISGFFGLVLIPEALGDGHWLGRFMGYELEHVPWAGCAIWDLIQPSFMFIVGVAMPFSIASRRAKGDSERTLWGHAVYRAVVLVLLGLFLRSQGRSQTYFTFEDVVSQIGLGYLFVFAMAGRSFRAQAIFAGAVLIGYWLLFALWPLPSADAVAALNPDAQWSFFNGFAAHWNKGLNPAGYFDHWFLNLFPRETPWGYHTGGYATLSFIPSMATMMFGAMAGEWMRGDRSIEDKCRMLVKCGVACLAFGFIVDGHLWPLVNFDWSIAPVVKRIWTPSWAVFSAGWVLLSLALFVYIVDIKGYTKWTLPFVAVGMNSTAAYVMHSSFQNFIADRLNAHFQLSATLGVAGEGVAMIGGVIVVWYILYWMYKRKVFIRI